MRQTGLGLPAAPLSGSVRVRAVVIATYAADEEARASMQGPYTPVAVTCDVLTYGGRHRAFLQRVPVMQTRHGLHDYLSTWEPRATTINLATNEAPRFTAADGLPADDPRDFDGEHVVVDFLENDPMQPIVVGSIGHPRSSFRQVKADGKQVRSRHRGVQWGIDDAGNLLVDARGANSGALTNGEETPASDDEHGNVTLRVPRTATVRVVSEAPDGDEGEPTFELTLQDGVFEVKLEDGAALRVTGSAGEAVTVLGDGAKSALIGEAWKAKYLELKAIFDGHTHPDGWGSTAPPAVQAPAWDDAILSTKLKFPNNG